MTQTKARMSSRAALKKTLTVLSLVAASLASVSAVPTAMSSASPSHHRDGTFQNNYIAFEPKGLVELLRWQLEAAWNQRPKPAQAPTPEVRADLAFIKSNAKAGARMQAAVTWVGHATLLVQAGGLNVLTDPIFSERASPFSFMGPKRHVAPGVSLAHMPRIDVVLISHNHYDHLDEASVVALGAQAGGSPLFVVPLGLKAWLAKQGVSNVVELDWWQSHHVGAVEVMLTPVQHWSARGVHDRMTTLWGGFAVLAPNLRWFFAGDTGYSPDFKDTRQRLAQRAGFERLDLALIPIGAYEPRWFMQTQHVNPDEAVQVHLDLGAKQSIGVHWGTFELTDEPLDEPPQTPRPGVSAVGRE